MKKTIFESVLVDYCPECCGFWLDGGEFERTLNAEEFDVESALISAKMEMMDEKDVRNSSWKCQKCPTGVIRPYQRSGLKLDKCDKCGGIFFDKGELNALFIAEKPGFLQRLSDYVRGIVNC